MTLADTEVDELEQAVFIARVAEQAGEYEDMLRFLEPIMDQKGSMMSRDERTLVYAACKQILDPDIKSIRTISAIESFGKYEAQQEYLNEYRAILCKRVDEKSRRIINLL